MFSSMIRNVCGAVVKLLALLMRGTYFYIKNIEASPFVYLQSEVVTVTAFCMLKQCAGILIIQIESAIVRFIYFYIL